MTSRGHAGAVKIGIETLKGIHRRQGAEEFGCRAIETGQILRAMRRFDFPESVAAVFDQAIERADASQRAKRRLVGGDTIPKVSAVRQTVARPGLQGFACRWRNPSP